MGSKRFESTFDFINFDVFLRCRSCKREKRIAGYRFRFMFNGGMPCPMHEVKRRLKCSGCGGKGIDIAPVPPLGD